MEPESDIIVQFIRDLYISMINLFSNLCRYAKILNQSYIWPCYGSTKQKTTQVLELYCYLTKRCTQFYNDRKPALNELLYYASNWDFSSFDVSSTLPMKYYLL